MAPNGTSQRAAEGFAELVEHLLRQVHGASFVGGLNPAQWSALRFLSRANPSARTLSSFVKFHAVTKSSAAQTLSSLRKKNMIRQRQSTEDRRVRYYELTASGYRAMRQDPLIPLVRAVQTLPAEQTSDLAMSLQGLLRAWFSVNPDAENSKI